MLVAALERPGFQSERDRWQAADAQNLEMRLTFLEVEVEELRRDLEMTRLELEKR